MTRSEAIELPSIYETKGRFATKIGYHLSASGTRTRSYHYLKKNQKVALAEAIQIAAAWEEEVKDFPVFVERIKAELGEQIVEKLDLSKPIWHTKGRPGAQTDNLERLVSETVSKISTADNAGQAEADWQYALAQLAASDPRFTRFHPASKFMKFPAETPSRPHRIEKIVKGERFPYAPSNQVKELIHQMPKVAAATVPTIEEVRNLFVAYKEQKVGGHTNRGGVQKITHRSLQNSLKGIFAAFDLVQIMTTDPISKLDGPTLETLFDRMYQRVKNGELSERTAGHYCGALKQMVEWAHRQSTINFRLPDNAEDILHVPVPKRTKEVRPYDPEIIKAILKTLKAKGDEKTALAVLLALCTGAYQSDIGNWGYQRQEDLAEKPYDNLVTDNGDTYVYWRRRKTRNHNGFFSLHLLPAEVVKLLNKHLMPNDTRRNPYMRLLLNTDGAPLYSEGANRPNDCIGRQYIRSRKEVEDEMRKEIADPKLTEEFHIAYPFEQFRKDVLNFIYQQSKSTDMTQKMAGHTNERAKDMQRQFAGAGRPGVLDAYLRDDFSDLTAILKQWHEQLRKDGIFEAAGIVEKKRDGR